MEFASHVSRVLRHDCGTEPESLVAAEEREKRNAQISENSTEFSCVNLTTSLDQTSASSSDNLLTDHAKTESSRGVAPSFLRNVSMSDIVFHFDGGASEIGSTPGAEFAGRIRALSMNGTERSRFDWTNELNRLNRAVPPVMRIFLNYNKEK